MPLYHKILVRDADVQNLVGSFLKILRDGALALLISYQKDTLYIVYQGCVCVLCDIYTIN